MVTALAICLFCCLPLQWHCCSLYVEHGCLAVLACQEVHGFFEGQLTLIMNSSAELHAFVPAVSGALCGFRCFRWFQLLPTHLRKGSEVMLVRLHRNVMLFGVWGQPQAHMHCPCMGAVLCICVLAWDSRENNNCFLKQHGTVGCVFISVMPLPSS